MERDQLFPVSSNASRGAHQVKSGGGVFATHKRTWLFLLQIAVEVECYIDMGKSGKVNERNALRVMKCI